MALTHAPFYWRTTKRSDGSYIDSRSTNEIVKSTNKSGLVKGAWITFADGSRFRKTTNYFNMSLTRTPGASENTDFDASSINKWNCKTGPGGCTNGNFTTGNWIFRLGSDYGVGNVLSSGPSFQTMENNEATTKALNKIADQKANLAENLATLGQTVRLFANPVQALVKGLKQVKADRSMLPYLRMSYRDMLRNGVSKKVAEKYLEYVYGFKPLMQDIYSLSEFAKSQSQKPLLLSAKGNAIREGFGRYLNYENVSQRRMEEVSDIQYRSRTSVTLWARIDPNYSGTRVLNQLGLINPASLVWELVPYSFVVDWILPVGPVLSALTAPAGLIFVNGSRSRRVSSQWTSTDYRYKSTEKILSSNPASNRWEYEGYNREVINSWPRPGLWMDFDPFRLSKGGSDRIFKALALSISGLRHGKW